LSRETEKKVKTGEVSMEIYLVR